MTRNYDLLMYKTENRKCMINDDKSVRLWFKKQTITKLFWGTRKIPADHVTEGNEDRMSSNVHCDVNLFHLNTWMICRSDINFKSDGKVRTPAGRNDSMLFPSGKAWDGRCLFCLKWYRPHWEEKRWSIKTKPTNKSVKSRAKSLWTKVSDVKQ